MLSNNSLLGKRSRPDDSYDDIEYYRMSKRSKYSDENEFNETAYASIPASTFRCDATTLTGNLFTETSVSAGSYQ